MIMKFLHSNEKCAVMGTSILIKPILCTKWPKFSAILLQETMIADGDCNSENINIFNIPHYNLIAQGRKYGRKVGLFIYLHENYNSTQKDLYNISGDWEGLFIDVTSPLLANKIILGNVYRPPRDNYSDASIDRFLQPFGDIIAAL